MTIGIHLPNDPFYSVFILYQREVYNVDHIYLQSMMDWIYMTMDSPYKFRNQNQAFLTMTNYGIGLKKGPDVAESGGLPSWDLVTFKLKHLKEIYVDKRHKDTCVLVSKISSSSYNNNVWEKSNPTNYTQFKPAASILPSTAKKSYLVTIIKFKDGHDQLLQSIQTLDKILTSFSNTNSTSLEQQRSQSISANPTNNNTESTIPTARPSSQQPPTSRLPNIQNIYDEKNMPRRVQRSNAQAYFNAETARAQIYQNTNKAPSTTAYPMVRTDLSMHQNGQSTYESQTLPRPLSTSSIRDIRSYNTRASPNSTDYYPRYNTINSRHSMTPTTFSNMKQTPAAPKQHQYGVFPVRSASRLTHGPMSANSSFDNISEISYSHYVKSIDKTQQRNNMPIYFGTSTSSVQEQSNQTFSNNFQQRNSLTRVGRSPRPVSLINTQVGGVNPRSNSVKDAYSFSKHSVDQLTSNEYDKTKPRHDYFRSDPSSNDQSSNGGSISRSHHHRPKTHSSMKLSQVKAVQMQSKRDSIIDANLDIIKAELDSIRINQSRKNIELSPPPSAQSVRPTSNLSNLKTNDLKPSPKTSTSPPYLKNESSRLQEIIDSFNNFEKKTLTKEATVTPSPISISSSIPNTPNSPATKSSFTNFDYSNETIQQYTDTIGTNYNSPAASPSIKPNVDGLINYFSNNANQQENKYRSSPKSPLAKTVFKKTSPLNIVNMPSSEPQRHSQPFNQLENEQIEQSNSNNIEIKPDIVTGRLDTEYYNKLFQSSTDLEPSLVSKPTMYTSPTEHNPITKSNDHLSMSVDSLENSVEPMTLNSTNSNTQILDYNYSPMYPQAKEPEVEIKTTKILDNDLYNQPIQKEETEYDLATYGLDMNVMNGNLEPIFKPIVLQKRSKNQGPGRKRTFANMVWPMSLEEERIMRSNSPFIVPEVIMTRNDSVRGILKKVDSVVTDKYNTINSVMGQTSGKRVEFGEKFAFVNVFERVEPDPSPNVPEMVKS